MKILPGGCRVFWPEDGQISSRENSKSRVVISSAQGAQHISQTIYEYGVGRSATFVNPVAEEVLYVAEGKGSCHIDGWAYPLRPGTGVYIPSGSEYSIENSTGENLRIVSASCPQDPGRHSVETPRDAAGLARFLVVHEEDREAIRAGKDREFRYLVHTDLGCREVTQFVGWIPPGKAPFHHHGYEEGIFILEGHGIVHVEDASSEFGPGSSIYFPKGVRHCLENLSNSPIRLLGVFYPSGSPGAAYED